ncbi:L-lactate dehydrogenase [Limosilactobacillus difficilis]|uniref:L-lactate dehydrogenase n=1 Tax=Limosilactobacillus difficilis TaxID=2991838 RepID=UPI0024B90C47|nr:L-lactate dehydrogenase [Limosilactobacillus difficilis]
MRKIAVIGLGNVGTTVAHDLLLRGLVDELVLIDSNEKKAQAEYFDFSDSFARIPNNAVIKLNDYGELKDADIVITSFGDVAATAKTGDRFAELPINLKNAETVGQKIKASGFDGILINISNPCDAIVNRLQGVTGLPHNRIFGTGTFLDTARMQRAVGHVFGEAPQNVSGFVLGEHGNSQFTAWSTVKIDGQPLTKLADDGKANLDELDKTARDGAFVVIEGKGYTCFAIAACAVEMVQAVFADLHQFMPASVFLEQYDCYIGYPAVIGKDGVERIQPVELTADEQSKLDQSAQTIKEKAAQGKN